MSAPQPNPAANPPAGGPQPNNLDPNPPAGGDQIDSGKYRETMRENQKLRQRLAEIDEQAKAKELAKLGKMDQLQKQLETQQAEMKATQERYAASEVKLLAKELRIRNPEHAYKLIRDELKLGKDGTPENAKDLLEALIKGDPYLVESSAPEPQPQPRPAQPNPGATNPSRSAGSQQITNPRSLTWNDVLKRP